MTVTDWDAVADFVSIGSGAGGLCSALAVSSFGGTSLVTEKLDKVGGSTAMSGGIMWIPDNPLMAEDGVPDSFEQGLAYFAAVVGDAGPATSRERTAAFLRTGPALVDFLRDQGIDFIRCEGWADYYDDRPGGSPRGRSIETAPYDVRRLGVWGPRLNNVKLFPLPLLTNEAAAFGLAGRTRESRRTIARVVGRAVRATLRGERLVNTGGALQGHILEACLRREVPVWAESPLVDVVEESGRVRGVLIQRHGRLMRIGARRGVLVNTGGFSHDQRMREKYQPSGVRAKWSAANPGDTGEVLDLLMSRGAATDLLEESWWIPVSQPPGATLPHFVQFERHKPFCIIVDTDGQRFVNEAVSYMELGQTMFRHNDQAGSIPSWIILDARHRRRYPWATSPPRLTPKRWLTSGYMRRADSLDELARTCGIDADGLRRTVERFNGFARRGIDVDFHKGERAYDRRFADPTIGPNPCLGPLEEAPFYAVQVFPGDVGTAGGLVTDEHARVLREDGTVWAGLYATGNCTASVMGRAYPGAGASIAASAVFGFRAALHAFGVDRYARQSSLR